MTGEVLSGQVLSADIRIGATTPCRCRKADATSPMGQSHTQAFLEATQAEVDPQRHARRATPTRAGLMIGTVTRIQADAPNRS